MATEKRSWPLHTRILVGLVAGAAIGIAANLAGAADPAAAMVVETVIKYVSGPLGRIFLNLLFMTVVPLVFATLTVGVAHLGDLKRLGRIGFRTLAFFLFLTTLATILGLLIVGVTEPGKGFDQATQQRLLETYRGDLVQRTQEFQDRGGFGVDTFINIIPRNPIAAMVRMDMLAVIFFALILGIALTRVRPDLSEKLLGPLEALSEAMIVVVGFAMKLAPWAVCALIFNVTARFGLELLEKLTLYVLVVFTGYILFQFGVYALLIGLGARLNPLRFFRRLLPVMVTAFSTSSSNATLPTTLKVSEEDLGIPADIGGFVLPRGATMNMNGTALYEGVTVLFLAQVFGIGLSLGQQVVVVLLSVLMAIGTAGVPGASLPMIMLVLASVQVPPEGIAIILGVDRILDMGRTVLNVSGDVVTATFVTRWEKLGAFRTD